jgi:CheY-like chemotaxis protein
MHGGAIEVRSPGRNQGTTFVVRLPRVMAGALEQPEPGAAPGTSSLGVLVVDDHPDTRDMMKLILCDRGVQVTTAGSADEAVAAYLASPCDVALIDISMPGEDGYACLRQLQAAAALSPRRLAAIAVTAHAREQDRADALEAGFAAHVAKPVDVDMLLATIRQLRDDPA